MQVLPKRISGVNWKGPVLADLGALLLDGAFLVQSTFGTSGLLPKPKQRLVIVTERAMVCLRKSARDYSIWNQVFYLWGTAMTVDSCRDKQLGHSLKFHYSSSARRVTGDANEERPTSDEAGQDVQFVLCFSNQEKLRDKWRDVILHRCQKSMLRISCYILFAELLL